MSLWCYKEAHIGGNGSNEKTLLTYCTVENTFPDLPLCSDYDQKAQLQQMIWSVNMLYFCTLKTSHPLKQEEY